MKFELLPILDKMEDLYRKPRNRQRFEEYLQMLQGSDKKDMLLPIAAYNPMGKEHLLTKIDELKKVDAENIMRSKIETINNSINDQGSRAIKVVLNLADDLGGAWTNRHTTDFTSKFKINPLVKRNFCTPHFWSSENYSASLIKNRSAACIYRTIYVIKNGPPITLSDHVNQEVYVNKMSAYSKPLLKVPFSKTTESIFKKYKETDDYSIIFNFFYGDAVSDSLGYPTYGIAEVNGFNYARNLASSDPN